jgi:hypothetical protein
MKKTAAAAKAEKKSIVENIRSKSLEDVITREIAERNKQIARLETQLEAVRSNYGKAEKYRDAFRECYTQLRTAALESLDSDRARYMLVTSLMECERKITQIYIRVGP